MCIRLSTTVNVVKSEDLRGRNKSSKKYARVSSLSVISESSAKKPKFQSEISSSLSYGDVSKGLKFTNTKQVPLPSIIDANKMISANLSSVTNDLKNCKGPDPPTATTSHIRPSHDVSISSLLMGIMVHSNLKMWSP